MFGQKCASTSDSPPHPIFTHHHQNYYISHCTCEKAAENGAFGCCFRHPFHHTPTRATGRFNLFFRLWRAKRPESLHRRTVAHVFEIHSHSPFPPPLFPSSEGPILAPRAQSPKWTPLHLPCVSWLAVYMGLCYQLAFALAPASLSIVAL